MFRAVWVIYMLLLFVPAGACPADSPFNVDFFCGWSGYFRPMQWSPVEIGISSTLTEPFAGSVTISAKQDGLNTMNVTREFVLTPDIPLHLPLVTKLAFAAEKCNVRITDKHGRTRWHYDFDLWNLSSRNRRMTVVNKADLLVGVIGSRKFGLVRLPNQSVCQSGWGTGKVYLASKLPRLTPWDWTGFTSLDLLILYNPDWSWLNRQQLKAVTEWVSNGGRVLLVLGSHPLATQNVLAKNLPFQMEEAKQITIKPEELKRFGLDFTEPETVTCWPYRPKGEARNFRNEVKCADETVFAVGSVGFGRIGMLAFDPSNLSDKQRANSSIFWTTCIKAVLKGAGTTGSKAKQPTKFNTRCPLTGDLTHPDNYEGGMELTIGGLKAGKYQMTSYHNDPFSRHSNISIFVDGRLYSRNNSQSRVRDDARAARAITRFTVNDSNKVIIEFRPVKSPLNERPMLCGFELTKLQGSSSAGKRVFGVDFGAAGQPVASGYIGLGLPENLRRKVVRFDSSEGLPKGITISLKPTNSSDNLQFKSAVAVSTQRPRDLVEVPYSRTIEFVEDAEDQDYNRSNERNYRTGLAQAGSDAVMEHLYNIPEMRPLSIWWVILLLISLAVLLGPVDYKILKRIKRLPLTWLSCSIWIVLFTAGAYYGVQALRAGKMQLRAVSVTDGISGTDCAWSTAYIGLFAPKSDDYRLEGLQKDQWWSGIAPAGEHISVYQHQAGTRNIYCLQQDGYSQPYSLPINIWTVQCLLDESRQERLPLRATLTRQDQQVGVNITNESDSAIKCGYVLFENNRIIKFGNIPPHTTRKFTGSLIYQEIWPMKLLLRDRYQHISQGRWGNENAFFAQGCLQRTLAMEGYLAQGAGVVCAEYYNAPLPIGVKGCSCNYNHIKLVRLVVFPE